MTPHHYCQNKAAASGSSFYYSFMFLAPAQRQAITALYAFCREVDDVVDEGSDPIPACAKLNWWRQEIDRVFNGTPTHPVGFALQEICPHFELPRKSLLEVIDGMAMDLQDRRYADFHALKNYCYHVASVVGRLSAAIFGVSDPHTFDYAHNLGIAFQLTNIIRDVGEDARRGRIYLPLDELRRFDVDEADILAARRSDNFLKLMAFQAERAQAFYEQALAKLPAADRKNQLPGLIMAAIYRNLLLKITQADFPVLERRVSLTPLRKVWLAGRAWLKERKG